MIARGFQAGSCGSEAGRAPIGGSRPPASSLFSAARRCPRVTQLPGGSQRRRRSCAQSGPPALRVIHNDYIRITREPLHPRAARQPTPFNNFGRSQRRGLACLTPRAAGSWQSLPMLQLINSCTPRLTAPCDDQVFDTPVGRHTDICPSSQIALCTKYCCAAVTSPLLAGTHV